ncbi:YIP1 family protein [Litoreibacter sp.]|nr:YIP1 family protein [Litoreibacter sp.]
MIGHLLKMVQVSVQSPKQGAEMVLSAKPAREALWSILAVVVVLSVILAQLMTYLVPAPPDAQLLLPFRSSPVMFALVMWGLLVLMVFCTHYIGAMFGGSGAFDDSLTVVIWLQTILLVIQVAQLILALISPLLAGWVGLVFGMLSIWIFVNFISVVHGFKNLALVSLGLLMALVGVVFGLSLIFVFIAIIFGVELPNA